jgi:hypothetical protein
LKKFRDELRIFADENDFTQESIDSPEWKKIVDMAQDLLKAFNYSRK